MYLRQLQAISLYSFFIQSNSYYFLLTITNISFVIIIDKKNCVSIHSFRLLRRIMRTEMSSLKRGGSLEYIIRQSVRCVETIPVLHPFAEATLFQASCHCQLGELYSVSFVCEVSGRCSQDIPPNLTDRTFEVPIWIPPPHIYYVYRCKWSLPVDDMKKIMTA